MFFRYVLIEFVTFVTNLLQYIKESMTCQVPEVKYLLRNNILTPVYRRPNKDCRTRLHPYYIGKTNRNGDFLAGVHFERYAFILLLNTRKVWKSISLGVIINLNFCILGVCETQHLGTVVVPSIQKKGDLRRHPEPAFVWMKQTRLLQRTFRNYLFTWVGKEYG